MIPTDETRLPKRRAATPPSLADDVALQWEIKKFNFEVEAFKASIEAAKRQKESRIPDKAKDPSTPPRT